MASAAGPSRRYGFASRARLDRRESRSQIAAEIARYVGAVSLLLVGAVHAELYYEEYYNEIPTIGRLFLLAFVGAACCGAILFAPLRRFGRGWGDRLLVLAALGGIGIAVGTFVSLLVSEYTPVFGFTESGYRFSIVVTFVLDVVTTALLGLFVVVVGHSAVRR